MLEPYTGDRAKRYEAERASKAVWGAEQKAIADMVHSGPVLDVPIGTGRYLGIYKDKGLWPYGLDIEPDMIAEALKKKPDLDYQIGSILSIPWPDKHFATVVCTRLLNWLEPSDMQAAVREMLRVSSEVVASIRLGQTVRKQTVTHTWRDLLSSLDGAWVAEQRQLRDENRNGIYWMLRIREPKWQDVEDQFRWNKNSLQTLADEWAERYGEPSKTMQDLPVTCRYLTGKEIYRQVKIMANLEPRLLPSGSPSVKRPPRRSDGPITWLQYADGYGQVDGRHRAYQWRDSDDLHPVLIVDAR